MKQLIFHNMLVLSEREQKARRIDFHKRRTILKGPNDTGKSSLIKTIYWTFGAEPARIHPFWRAANVTACVSFSIDDTERRLLRDGDRFTLFDSDNRPIKSFNRVTSQLSPYLAKLFNFPLRLAARGDREETQATPAFLFLPFYFDQDASWTTNWSGFTRLGQFAAWRQDVAQFHTGVRPAEYYIAKSNRMRAVRDKAKFAGEREVIQSVKERLEDELPVAQFDVDLDTFRVEIDELLAESATLQRDEERIRSQTVRLHNERESLLQQIAITEAAVRELAKDFEFAATQVDDEVLCPTCRTPHTNSFAERFFIAQDEDKCIELLAKLTAHLEQTDDQIAVLSRQLGEAMARSQRIQEILQRKRGEVTLHQIVQAESKKHLKSILKTDMATLHESEDEAERSAIKAKDRMDQCSDKTRHRKIREFYVERMREFLHTLDVLKMSEDQYRSLHAEVKESGSDQPRALLAYYFAILHTITEYSSSTFCPIVVDSPNQQDQDPKNWPKMVNFIVKQQPVDSQLVLGLVDEAGIKLEGRIIELDEKYSVLQRSAFPEVSEEIRALRARSFT